MVMLMALFLAPDAAAIRHPGLGLTGPNTLRPAMTREKLHELIDRFPKSV